MLEHALRYARKGWPIFPCNANKEPMVGGGVKAATTDERTIRNWWAKWPEANIALNVGAAGMLLVDTDPGHDMDELNRAVEGLPATALMSSTPRDGKHRFYALAEGEGAPPSVGKLAPHVDIRCDNSYALLPPSATADGEYAWDCDPDDLPTPAFRSDALLKACGERRVRGKAQEEWLIRPDAPANIEAAIKWLQEVAKPSVEGEGGDRMLYDTACMMRSFGLSEQTGLDLLHEVYNAKCFPPWEYDALQVKVDNAYRYATSSPGNLTPDYRLALVQRNFRPATTTTEGGGVTSKFGRYTLMDREALDNMPPPEWLIPDFLAKRSSGMLVGARGTFKTFLAMDILMSVAAGNGLGNNRLWPSVLESGPVLLAVGEGQSGLSLRAKAWEKVHAEGEKQGNFYVISPVVLIDGGMPEWEMFIEGALAASPEGYVLVVIDTAGRAMQGLNENTQEDASKLTMLIQLLQERLDCAVLVIHHAGTDAPDRARGSTVFEADADMVVVVSREAKDNRVKLRMTKQKDAPEWEQPRYADLKGEGDTLVVMRCDEKIVLTPEPKRGKKMSEAAIPAALDPIVAFTLKGNPLKAWTNTELSETLAVRDDLDIPSRLIRKQLVTLRETSSTLSAPMYDVSTKRWRYRQ